MLFAFILYYYITARLKDQYSCTEKLLLWNTHGGHSVRPHAPTTPLGSETRDTPRDATSMSACARQPSPASAPASARDRARAVCIHANTPAAFAALRRSCSCTPQQPCTHREHLSLRAMMAASDADAATRRAACAMPACCSGALEVPPAASEADKKRCRTKKRKFRQRWNTFSFFFCAFCLSTFACMLLRCVSVHAACFAQRARRVRSSRSARMQGDGPAP